MFIRGSVFKTLSFVSGCVLSLSAVPVCAVSVPDNLPEEFRSLWQGQEEMVEVKLYERSLGLFKVSVTPDGITVLEPERLLESAGTNEKYRAELLSLLGAPLSRNGNRSCQGGSDSGSSGCNFIQTDRLAVVFDDSESVLYLFLGRDVIKENSGDERYWHPTPEVKRAFLHRQTLNFAENKDSRTLSVNGAGATGVTENSYAVVDWLLNWQQYDQNTSTSPETAINSLYWRYDIARRYYFQTGRMDNTDLARTEGGNFSFSLLPLPRIEGARAGTTQTYLRQRNTEVATPVTLMLTRFSRVEAWRNNQLLGTWYLDAGVQQLNTRSLPEGSYLLDLRIYEQDTLVRTEQYPFSKSGMTEGDLQWDTFIQGGKITDDTGENDNNQKPDNAVTAGFRIPLGRSLSFMQGISLLDSNGYYESTIKWNGSLFEAPLGLSLSRLWGAYGTRGSSETLTWSPGVSLSFYHYQSEVNNCGSNQETAWSGCNETYNASLSLPLSGWSAMVGYSDSRNKSFWRSYSPADEVKSVHPWEVQQGRTRTWQINASRSFLYEGISLMSSLGVYRSQSDGRSQQYDNGLFINFSLSQNSPSSRNVSRNLRGGYNLRRNKQGGDSDEVWMDAQWSQQTESARRELAAHLSGSSYGSEAVVRGQNNNRFGDLNGSLSVSKEKNNGTVRHGISLTYDSSFAVNRDGFFWGGSASGITNLAGSTVTVNGADSNIPLVALRGGGYGWQSLGGGQKTLLPLNALTPADVYVEEVDKGQINVQISGGGESQVFLLPGYIYARSISAKTSLTWTGRALDEHDTPLADALILNTGRDTVSGDGGFSVEMNTGDRFIYLLKDNRLYSCPMVSRQKKNSLVLLGEISCQQTEKESLPENIVKRSEVSGLLASKGDN
ncbi:hypothetical protein FHN97_20630 [Salmonella enterica]|nr:hypothetical protein [Salmonella enterica]ECF7044180.1 hypothetical protein [Salmonella enterica subsp. enterica]EDR5750690.1 hypothetical protein [Salmonella enterica subsp. enterica serovar Cubana]EBF2435112.1 hypothetical protein [Salmonella enterica]EBN7034255.1 hypothetical protein [Salmonella enterica]